MAVDELDTRILRLLMEQPRVVIDEAVATSVTKWRPLPKPVPVFVVYETAFADADGKLQFRSDIYNRDAEIWQLLKRKSRTMAERDAKPRGEQNGKKENPEDGLGLAHELPEASERELHEGVLGQRATR